MLCTSFPVQNAQLPTLVRLVDTESPYGRTQEGSGEQGSQEWNCHALPKHCTRHQLARSKGPCVGGQLEKEIGS